MKEHRGDRGPFPLWGLILVALGVIFLLQNLGVLGWGVWGTLWRFWPVVLLLIGLNIILRGQSPWLMLGITVVVLIGVIAAAALVERSRPPAVAASFSQPLQGITGASAEISFGAGELLIASLPPGSASLVEGMSYPEVEQDFRLQGSKGVLNLSVPGRGFWTFGERGLQLAASFNPAVPLELVVKTGASDAQLDLTNLQVRRLEVDVGASRLSLLLPAKAGTTEAEVKAGAAQVSISIPQGVAARIKSETGLGSFNVDTSRFPKVGDIYESPGYATAPNRVDLTVKSGVASIDIR
ncbi:MAG: cell wall-active antibiotics response protein [Chloroflexi bacterium]|nr:cell wall-active antibiotics response protein [Chloroflexota bacterium]